MTCVFQKLIAFVALQRNQDGPGFGPGLGIVDGGLVIQRVRVDAGQTLGQFHIRAVMAGIAGIACAVGADGVFVGEIGGLDHQGVAFPMAARIAHVLADCGAQMRRGHRRGMTRASWIISLRKIT